MKRRINYKNCSYYYTDKSSFDFEESNVNEKYIPGKREKSFKEIISIH